MFSPGKDCTTPDAIVNAGVDYEDTLFDSTATYTCDEGWEYDGTDDTIRCQDDGSWEGTTFACTGEWWFCNMM